MPTSEENTVPVVMRTEKSLKGSYWATVVMEDDTGRGYFEDNSNAISINPGYYYAEGGNGKPLLIVSYLENPMMRKSKMKKDIGWGDGTLRLNGS